MSKVNDAQPQEPLAGAGFTLYKKDAQGVYNVVKEIAAGTVTTFEFKGIDDGDYKLEESTVPAGYNKLADIEFTVTSVKDDAGKTLTSINGVAVTGKVNLGTQEADVDMAAGSLTTTVVNKSGSTLPSTGGMGTTILYVVGAALVVFAGVGLVLRRRNKDEG